MDSNAEIYFSWLDYTLFSLTLIFSFLVGIYFGLWRNRAETTNEYLLAGRSMQIIPIALSVIASLISGNTIVAVPAEIYKFGTYYVWTLFSEICAAVVAYFVFMPVYFKLRVTSIYQYVRLRFDLHVLRLVSVLNIIASMCYIPTVLYLPALTFSKGFGIYGIIVIVSVVCIVYTTIGGLKAVVWTDALQFGLMLAAMITILILGVNAAGGFPNVWNKTVLGGRLDIFDFRVDPTLRDTFWATLLGNFFFQLTVFPIHQGTIQKYLALPDFVKVKICLGLHMVGVAFIKVIVILTGMVVYANYAGCDPFVSKQILRMDQLVPHFVMDITRGVPGLPGLYTVGIFSAALSTLSSTLNTVATCIYQDILFPFISDKTSEKFRTKILKVLVVLVGAASILMVILIEKVGGIFAFTTAVQGISAGPILGIFILGILFPFANAKGALISGLTGLVFASWIIGGSIWYKSQGLLTFEEKPASVENCSISLDPTDLRSVPTNNSQVFILYRISFWYTTMMSTIIVVVTGLLVCLFTKNPSGSISPDLLSPVIYRFLGKAKSVNGAVYYDVCNANVVVNANDCKDEKSNKSLLRLHDPDLKSHYTDCTTENKKTDIFDDET